MQGRVFEDLSVGDSAGMTRIVTAAVIEAFADVSTDSNPVHLDAAYAEGTIFKGRIAHGMLSGAYISAVIGMQLPGPGTIYLSQASGGRSVSATPWMSGSRWRPWIPSGAR
jgi:3-hydroxybutyryl-CoA dehydratase